MKNKYSKRNNLNLLYLKKKKVQLEKAHFCKSKAVLCRKKGIYLLEMVSLYIRSVIAPSDENSSSSLTVTSWNP